MNDLLVIGGGSAGLTGARFAARLGARVTLIESDRIGGDCTWTGCVPSKTLIRVAHAVKEIRGAERYGVSVGTPTVEMGRVRAHIRASIERVYEAESPEALRAEGIDVVLDRAQFVDETTVQAGDRRIEARRFVIATGAHPSVPPIPGLAGVDFITYEQVFDTNELPDHLLVLGAGPVGLELACAYRALGSRVTVLALEALPDAEARVRECVEQVLVDHGVDLVRGPVDRVDKDGDTFRVEATDATHHGDVLLVAAGRRPTVEGLGLDAAGVKHSAGGIEVDAYLRTSNPRVYAAGDVLGGAQFTHLAGWQCFQAVRNALLPGRERGIPAVVPSVIFLDPEIATVGLSEADARDRFGDRCRVHRWGMAATDRAITEDASTGFVEIVSGPGGKILGATVVAARAGELIAELALAIQQGIGLSEIATTIHPYPTWSTTLQQLASRESTDRFLDSRTGKIALWLAGLGRRSQDRSGLA